MDCMCLSRIPALRKNGAIDKPGGELHMDLNENVITPRVLREREVRARTGIKSRTGIYERLKPTSRYYDPSFPKPFKIGLSAVGWDEGEIIAWVQSRRVSR